MIINYYKNLTNSKQYNNNKQILQQCYNILANPKYYKTYCKHITKFVRSQDITKLLHTYYNKYYRRITNPEYYKHITHMLQTYYTHITNILQIHK